MQIYYINKIIGIILHFLVLLLNKYLYINLFKLVVKKLDILKKLKKLILSNSII